METTKEQMFPAVVLIVLGCILRYFTNRIVTLAYRETFYQREYKQTLIDFVEKKRLEALSKVQTEEEAHVVNQEFDYFKSSIQSEIIRYYNKYEIDKNGRYKRIEFK